MWFGGHSCGNARGRVCGGMCPHTYILNPFPCICKHHVYEYVHMYIRTYMPMHIRCFYASMYVCMHVCMYASAHVCVMHVCMYACAHVCMHSCMNVNSYHIQHIEAVDLTSVWTPFSSSSSQFLMWMPNTLCPSFFSIQATTCAPMSVM